MHLPLRKSPIVVLILTMSCLLIFGLSPVWAQTAETTQEFEFTFDTDAEGWTGGFADLPANADRSIYELDSGFRALPEGLTGNGLYIQGHNRSDDLFMYLTRQMDGLQPSTEYQVSVEVDLATNVPGGSVGIGGSPGESVFVKAGASPNQPSESEDSGGWLRSNIDKGNQSTDGSEMIVIGNVSHPDVLGDEYKIKTLSNEGLPLSATTDENGSLWLILGTDSGFEGLTALYYSRISYRLEATAPPFPIEKVTGTITYRERIALTPNAVAEIQLVDISRADAPAVVIGEQIIENPGQVPISFEIEYDIRDIDDRFTYAVQARITESGELAFINDTIYSVITRGSPTHVDMVLISAKAPPPPNPGDPQTNPPTAPGVGDLALSGWLLAVLALVGALSVGLGVRALAISRS